MTRTITPETRSILDASDWSTISPMAGDPGMRNQAAREFIVSGRQLMLRSRVGDIDKVDKSIRCFEQALKLEPNSAVAHAYLASAAGVRLHYTPEAHFLEQSEKEAREALRLEPDSPDAHRALAGIFYNTGNLSEALEQALLAIEAQGPEERVSNLLGMTLQAMGQPGRALAWLDMAKHLASLPGDYDPIIGDCWTLLGDDQRAEDAYRRAINLRPESPDGWVGLCHVRLVQRNFDAARQLCRENYDRSKNYADPNMDAGPILAQIEFFARNYAEAEKRYSELAKNDPNGGGTFYGEIPYNSALGRLRQLQHDEKSSREILQACLQKEAAAVKREPQNSRAWYRLAAVESCLGKTDSALDHLAAAIKAGWIDARSPQLDPRFDGIAADARFQELIQALTKKVGELKRQIGQPFTMAATGESHSP
jgi:tetratricopeptide (TPR) repeat protein